jgi:hypothetical protein
VVGSLTSHEPCGDSAQLAIHERNEFAPCFLVARAGATENQRNPVRRFAPHERTWGTDIEGFLEHFPQDINGGQAPQVMISDRCAAKPGVRERARNMIDLVLWSFIVCLIPLVMEFLMRLMSVIALRVSDAHSKEHLWSGGPHSSGTI